MLAATLNATRASSNRCPSVPSSAFGGLVGQPALVASEFA
ncbi:hypothetical protein ABIC09_006744 [Bradyrhizobium sp. S3.12.5]